MTDRESEVLAELSAFLNDAAGAHGACVEGLRLLRTEWVRLGAVSLPVNPDAKMWLTTGAPISGSLAYQSWRLADIPRHLADDGPVVNFVGQQWAVAVDTAWEDHFRPRLAAARGAVVSAVTDPVMADLRRIRNDVVHHGGLASDSNAGRCTRLVWARVGVQIIIDRERVAQFMSLRGLAVGFTGPEGT